MSTVVNKGWLKDNVGDKFAPKTLLSQVVGNDGKLLETYINNAVYADVEDNKNIQCIKDGDETFELIESFTTTEEITKFERTTELDGTPYNFKKIKVIVKQPKSSNTGSAGIICIDENNPNYKSNNTAYISANIQAFNNQYCTVSQYNAIIENGLLTGNATTILTSEEDINNIATYIEAAGYRQGFVCRNVFDICETVSMEKIDYIRYGSLNSYPIPIGTIIDVYGMRFESDRYIEEFDIDIEDIAGLSETLSKTARIDLEDSENIEDIALSNSWNDLTDKPFYSEMGVGEILPEITVIIGDIGAIVQYIPLIIDETYTVNWNGATYECIAQPFIEDGTQIGISLGNVGAITGENPTTEPFVLVASNADGEEATILYALDGSINVTISISGMTEIIYPLEEKFLPELKGQREIIIDLNTNEANINQIEALKMDLGELKSAITILYNGYEYSASTIMKKLYTTDDNGNVLYELRIGFENSVYDGSNLIEFYTVKWLPSGVVFSSNQRPHFNIPEALSAVDYHQILAKMPGGGSEFGWYNFESTGFYGICLRSTTPGSNKKFLVTVDDNGTLTATEQ